MKNLILSAFALLLITGCHKYDDTAAAAKLQVPPYTETGANTFGCLLDGAVWANFGKYVGNHLFGTASNNTPNEVTSRIASFGPNTFGTGFDTVFTVGAEYSLVKNGTELKAGGMSIQLPKNGSLKGTHLLLTDSNGTFRYYVELLPYSEYDSKARNPFTVIITKDSLVGASNHIVSGKFYGILYNRNNLNDSVRIVGGVFDTKTQ
jgi:hypothetical protein